jgi:7-keto-8-aminopelargonate synthetase-like enzyme
MTMVMHSPPGAETVIDGRRYLYFVGTGYLGLQGHPAVIDAACDAMRKYGIGSATSRAGYGDMPPTLEVESRAASFCGTEDAFYFASGYVGNQLLVASLCTAADALFLDACAHYSIVDACRCAGRPTFSFAHADAGSLRETLHRQLRPGQRPVIFSDGVFAARGTLAPVADYADVLGRYPGAVLCLDDCHGLGVLGQSGRGTLEHFGYDPGSANTLASATETGRPAPQLFWTATLSKAFGGYGGILCGSRAYVQRVKAASHYYDGASAPAVPSAAASARGLQLVADDPGIITRLQTNAAALKRGLARLGLRVDRSPVPIVCLELGTAADMQRIQQDLMRQGILIAYQPCYSGLGPAGALRLAVFATHTDAMIATLIDALEKTL